jgi:hypothetical protein
VFPKGAGREGVECGKTFEKEWYLKKHQARHERDEDILKDAKSGGDASLKNSLEKSASLKKTFSTYVCSHVDGSQPKGTVCGAVFLSADSLKKHGEIHKKKPFTCSWEGCNGTKGLFFRYWASAEELAKHVAVVHEKEKRVIYFMIYSINVFSALSYLLRIFVLILRISTHPITFITKIFSMFINAFNVH